MAGLPEDTTRLGCMASTRGQVTDPSSSQRASEGTSNGEGGNFSGVDASSILAALPPGLGQAASALTSFASSFKRTSTTDRDDGTGEGVEGEQHGDEDVKKEGEHVEGQYEHHNPGGDHGGDEGDEYRNDAELSSTAAAIAAMESLAAQTSMQLQDQGHHQQQKAGGGRAKRDNGPDAERARKDNHKEVERKRREQISNGITELAAIVPGCDAKGVNKTAVINAAVRYIQELKNNEASNIEKWTLEKLLMDQAMNDLNQHLEANRKEVARLRAQLGIEGEPEEVAYQQDHHQGEEEMHQGGGGEQGAGNLDPNLETAAREDAAASALSEVAAAAAAAAAEASQASADATAVEKEALAEAPRGRSRGHADVATEAKEATGRGKRTRHG